MGKTEYYVTLMHYYQKENSKKIAPDKQPAKIYQMSEDNEMTITCKYCDDSIPILVKSRTEVREVGLKLDRRMKIGIVLGIILGIMVGVIRQSLPIAIATTILIIFLVGFIRLDTDVIKIDKSYRNLLYPKRPDIPEVKHEIKKMEYEDAVDWEIPVAKIFAF